MTKKKKNDNQESDFEKIIADKMGFPRDIMFPKNPHPLLVDAITKFITELPTAEEV